MANQPSGSRKRISIDDIRLGMYVVALDRSWLRTPFFFHRKLVTSAAQVDALRKAGIAGVIIDTARGLDVAREEMPALGGSPAGSSGHGRAASIASAAQRSTAEIAFEPVAAELVTAQTIHEEALVATQSIFDGAGGGARVNTEVAQKVVANLADSINRSPEANLLLMQMRRFQKDLFTHGVNVCVLALVVNAVEKFDNDEGALGLGALLHDVGETRLPRNLLRKRDGCSEAELRLLEQHPSLGAALLDRGKDIPAAARRIILEHHERIDGSGYPHRRSGSEVSLPSQIVAITDAYDDMLSGGNRPMLQPTEVLRQLFTQSRSGSLDRTLVERIIRSLGVYPIGSLVELDSGERAIVVAANRADSLRPIVKIISSRTGSLHSLGPIVSLAAGGEERRQIVRALDPVKERIDPMAFLKLAPALAG